MAKRKTKTKKKMKTKRKTTKSTRKRSPAYGERARGFLGEEIRHHVKDKGMPQDQAVAAAMSEARRKGMRVPKERKRR